MTASLARTRVVALSVAAASVLSAPAAARVITVGAMPECEFRRPEHAIAVAQDGDEVRISGSYTGVAAALVDRRVTIAGGYGNCTDATRGGTTVLDGQGPPARSILTLRGAAEVRIVDVSFMHGDEGEDTDLEGPDDGEGGCIDYQGTGSLTLRSVKLSECRAYLGGGLAFFAIPLEAPARLRLEDAVEIARSEAGFFAGGLLVAGNVDATFRGAGLIVDNLAPFGGGVMAYGPVKLDIATTPSTGQTYFARNRAERAGSSIVAANPLGGALRLRMYSVDPAKPLLIAADLAGDSVIGVNAIGTAGGTATACLWDTAFVNNETASVASVDGDAGLYFNPAIGAAAAACGARPAEAKRCPPSGTCNQIVANGRLLAADNEALFLIGDGDPRLELDGLVIGPNRTRAFLVDTSLDAGDAWRFALRNSVAYGGRYTSGLIGLKGSGTAELRHATIVGNDIGLRGVLSHDGTGLRPPIALSLVNSIIDQPARSTIDNPSRFITTASYLAATDISTLPVGSIEVVKLASPGEPSVITPGYVNAAERNYQLRNDSFLVDYAPASDALTTDQLGRPRTRDLETAVNQFGPRDLGAYETQREIGEIFADGFE